MAAGATRNARELGRRISYHELADVYLYVDATLEGRTAGTFSDDLISRLLPCGNRSGFRIESGCVEPADRLPSQRQAIRAVDDNYPLRYETYHGIAGTIRKYRKTIPVAEVYVRSDSCAAQE